MADGILVMFCVPIRSARLGSIASKVEASDTAETSIAGPSRIGITIPKKTGNAVVRNHWKRLIREAFRTSQHEIPAGFDFVVRPKKDAVATWRAIQKSVPKLAQRAAKRFEQKRTT